MKTMIQKTSLATALIASCLSARAIAEKSLSLYQPVTESATQIQPSKPSAKDYEENYAEELYRDVKRFAYGAVDFQLRTVAVGRLTELSNKKVGNLIAASAHVLAYTDGRVHLKEIHFVDAPDSTLVKDFNVDLSDYADGGLPLEFGIYRKLEVTTRLGDQSRTHEALELCWPLQVYCTVIDAAQTNLDNTVRGIRKLRAEGPAFELTRYDSKEPATQIQTLKSAANDYVEKYAEELYRDVERFSKGAVNFRLRTVAVGRLTELPNGRVGDLVSASKHFLAYTEGRVELTDLHFGAAEPGRTLDKDYNVDFSEYAAGGLKLESGIYRKLEVMTSLGDQSRTHEALELCWPSQDYCTVIDAAQTNLDNTVRGIRKLRAEGPAYTLTRDDSVVQSKQGYGCILLNSNDNPWKKVLPPYAKTGKSGVRVLWSIWVSEAGGKMHCLKENGICVMKASSHAYASRVESSAGRTVKCDRQAIAPEDGRKGKVDFETGCAIGRPGKQVKFDVKVEGSGMSAEVNHEAAEAEIIHKNGLTLSDQCLL
jgi:hypothetical protein